MFCTQAVMGLPLDILVSSFAHTIVCECTPSVPMRIDVKDDGARVYVQKTLALSTASSVGTLTPLWRTDIHVYVDTEAKFSKITFYLYNSLNRRRRGSLRRARERTDPKKTLRVASF